MAVPFDPQRLTVMGSTVPVVDGVLQTYGSLGAHYSLSATGSLVYVPGGAQAAPRTLVWVDRQGLEQPLPAPARPYVHPRLSPNDNGQRVAVMIEELESSISVYDRVRDTFTPLTFHKGLKMMGAWTPDGTRVVFDSALEGRVKLFWQLADGSGNPEPLETGTGEALRNPSSWSPNGQLLAFVETGPTTGEDIWVLQLSDHKAQPLVRTPATESAPQFSPDGRWLAYMSDASSRFEIYVQPYPGSGGKRQITTDGGTEPVWNRNGRELFYRSGSKMMAVDITTEPAFSKGKPHMLFEGPYLQEGTLPNYDVSVMASTS